MLYMHSYLLEIKKGKGDPPRNIGNISKFNTTAFGKALSKGLDESTYTYMITCINPMKSAEGITKTVLEYSAGFHKIKKKQQLASPHQIATAGRSKIKKAVKLQNKFYILKFNFNLV